MVSACPYVSCFLFYSPFFVKYSVGGGVHQYHFLLWCFQKAKFQSDTGWQLPAVQKGDISSDEWGTLLSPEKCHAGVMCTWKGWEGICGDCAGLSLSLEDNFSLLHPYPATAVAAGLGWGDHGRAVMRLGGSDRNCSHQLWMWHCILGYCLFFKCRNMGYCRSKILSCDLWDVIRALQGVRWVFYLNSSITFSDALA